MLTWVSSGCYLMMKARKLLFSALASFVDRSSSIGGQVSVVVLFCMAALITVDVLGRYFFNRPTYVADELSGYFLATVAFLALGYTQKLRKHMRVVVLIDRLTPKRRERLEISVEIITLIYIIWFAWITLKATVVGYALGEVSETFLRTPLWIVRLLLPLGLSVLALQLIVQMASRIRSWRAVEDIKGKASDQKA